LLFLSRENAKFSKNIFISFEITSLEWLLPDKYLNLTFYFVNIFNRNVKGEGTKT
jgi:hypothetical protein